MSILSMTDDEIRRRYREGSPIGILAELNACSVETIKQLVSEHSKLKGRPDPHQGIEKKPRATPEEVAARIVVWKQLYEQGLSDGEISRRTNCVQSLVTAWRKGLCLPVNVQEPKKTKSTEVAKREAEQMKLFNSGLSDAKIAIAVNVSIGTNIKWRDVNKLRRRVPHAKPVNDVTETVIKVPEIVNAAPDPVIEVKTLPVIHPTPVSLEEREMFFADICDVAEEITENHIPPVHAPVTAADPDPFSALRKVKEMCWPPKIELPPLRVLSEAVGKITVSVRWFDGYLENFEATEIRFGSDLLWMRLESGSNRNIPLRQVRWFAQKPESHEKESRQGL